ncbi:hypothetical protein Y032_0055g2629 [Ancylostoma ceylanicum]|uniref:Peptidase M13 C-terminal domain-containing protein n=1 Tax=Ancylostoma ceylanicum TaxID=53326 RepID=A0A016U5K1_9BILA|nr:hypothetical protein Y032_0055g2629 [Ancylostoma ceylanicum]
MLLAYFNRNKTVNPALVPEIFEHFLYPSRITTTFHNRYNVLIYRMATSPDLSTSEAAFQLLFNFTWQICIDTNSSCDKDGIFTDVRDVHKFMIQLEKAHESTTDQGLSSTDLWKPDKKVVNWTEYLHLVCPPDAHRCISSDSAIREDDPEVMARIHLLLKNTTERVITNYVMLLYALSWADFLDEDYRSIVNVNWTEYLHLVCPPDAHRCISSDSAIREDDPEVMARIHLLLKNTTERVITNYVMLLYALSWADFLDEDYRSIVNAILKKLKKMKRFIAYYDSHLFDLDRLDKFYENLAQIDDFEKLSFLELVDKFDRMDTEERLKNLGLPKKSNGLETKGDFKLNELVTAINQPFYNQIDIYIGLLQFPYFGLTLPKSFNYGAIGTVIGHEVTHGFDNKGSS